MSAVRQAVVLAAGLGTRMWPLSATRPKPLVPVANRPLLAHLLDSLRGAGMSETVVVVPPGREIPQTLGRRWGPMRLRYVIQPKPEGTGHALARAEGAAAERFLAVNGDLWAPAEEIRALARAPGPALGFRKADRPENYGVIRRRGSRVVGLVEKPRRPPSREINAGLYSLDSSIFRWLERAPRSPRGEIELTWALGQLLREGGAEAVPCPRSLDLSYPWDLLALNARLLEGLPRRIEGEVERGATLKGPVAVGPGSRVRAGAYVEGPVLIGRDCDIGPNCYLRGATSVGDGVRIGNAVEVKNSLLFSRTRIGHLSYVGDSVVGEGCNLGAGTITANLRLDGEPIRARMQGRGVETGLRKLGAVLGDGVRTSIHASLNVGALIPPGARVVARMDA